VKTVIFDFDGTIADSFGTVVAIFHELTHRKQPVTIEEMAQLRRMRLLDVAEVEHIPKWRIPFLVIIGRRRMAQSLTKVQVFAGMTDVIKELHADGHQLFIMSSNSSPNVKKFLHNHELTGYFKRTYGGVGLFGKARAFRRIMRQNNLIASDCLYVGDEVRDIEGSRDAGVACIAVSWGFNDAELLQDQQPLAVVDTPQKLLRTIRKQADT
jgi:phosphoglycolate phosphatase